MNQPRLDYNLGYEDFLLGQQLAAQLATLAFDTSVLGMADLWRNSWH